MPIMPIMPDLQALLRELRRVMASFTQRPHEGLAVAVGVEEVVERVVGYLSADSLRRNHEGPNLYPDIVSSWRSGPYTSVGGIGWAGVCD
jgi:hypothetical protein